MKVSKSSVENVRHARIIFPRKIYTMMIFPPRRLFFFYQYMLQLVSDDGDDSETSYACTCIPSIYLTVNVTVSNYK